MSNKSMAVERIVDTSAWNPVLYAVYYQRMEILKYLMEEHVVNFILALRLPPYNDFTEYITPNNQKMNEPWPATKRQNDSS